MAQHAQHLADLTTPRPKPWVPTAEPFRTDLGADRLRAGLYRLTLRPDEGAVTLHGTLRVAEHGTLLVAAGDLYRYPRHPVRAAVGRGSTRSSRRPRSRRRR